MRCEELLAALETGGFVRRIRARRHAARCARCAAARAKLMAMKEKLASPEPLSPRARQLWQGAAEEMTLEAERRRSWRPVLASATGAACIATLLLMIIHHRQPARPGGGEISDAGPKPTTTVVQEVDPADELSRLAAATERLNAELKTLREKADRADAQRQVASAIQRFSRW